MCANHDMYNICPRSVGLVKRDYILNFNPAEIKTYGLHNTAHCGVLLSIHRESFSGATCENFLSCQEERIERGAVFCNENYVGHTRSNISE